MQITTTETKDSNSEINPVVTQLINPFGTNSINPFGANNGLLSTSTITNNNVKTSNKVSSAEFNGEIHLEIKSRNAKKSITFVTGLADTDLDLDKLVGIWRKKYCCSAAHDEGVIKLAGDRRECVVEYLIENNIATNEQIKVHGY